VPEFEKNKHRNMAVLFWLMSWLMAMFGGVLFSIFENIAWDKGIYWALTTVTTVGYGDITPSNLAGYVIADCTMILTIPIWTVAVGFATSWFTSLHIWEEHEAAKLDRRLMHRETQQHVSAVIK